MPAPGRARWSPSKAPAGSARRACWPPRGRAREAGHAHAARPRRQSSNAPSPSASCASCSSRALFTAHAERDAGLRRGRPRRARCSRRAEDGRDESSYARLHGLYWLCANLAAEQPLRGLRRRRPVGGRAEPELPRLPAAAARGPPDRAAARHPPAAPSRSPTCCAAIVTDPATRCCARTALSGDAVGDVGPRRPSTAKPPTVFCAACHETTGGNPFLVRELLHEVTAQAADGHRRRGRGRARARPGSDLDGRAAAPEAPPAYARPRWRRRSRSSARAPSPRSPPSSRGSTTDGRRGGARGALPRRRPHPRRADRLGFVHPIVLSAIYNDLPVRARSDGHARAARLLPPRSRAGGDRLAPRAARRRARDAWAVEALRAAAQRARSSLGDPATAVGYLERALAEPPVEPSRGRARRRSPARSRQSGRPAAEEHFREAMRLAPDAHERGPDRARARPLPEVRRRLAVGDRRPAHAPSRARRRRPARRGTRGRAASPRPTSRSPPARCSRPRSLRSRARGAAHPARPPAPAGARAFEIVIAAGPAERSAELARRGALRAPSMPTDVAAGGPHVPHRGHRAAVLRALRRGRAPLRPRRSPRRAGAASSVGFAAASSLRVAAALPSRRPVGGGGRRDRGARPAQRRPGLPGLPRLRAELARLRLASNAATPDAELLALADDFFATQPTEDLPYSQAIHARGWLRARARRPPRAAWRSCWRAASASSSGASGRRRSSPGGRAPPRSA